MCGAPKKVQVGIGSDLTFYSKPSLLDTIYGNHPISWKLVFRIPPGRMDMSMHGMHRANGTRISAFVNRNELNWEERLTWCIRGSPLRHSAESKLGTLLRSCFRFIPH